MFNGCLLPVFSICLLLCLNDPQFMSASPQKSWANIFLFLSVSITLFLSSNVFIQKMFGHLMSGVQTKLCIAGSVAGLRNYLRRRTEIVLRGKYFQFYQVWEASILGVMIFVWIHRKHKAGSRQREVWSQLISSSHIYLIRCWLHWINHSYRNWNL